jgi:hypothetical protein
MVNNSTSINKTYNYLSPQVIEQKIDHNIWQWKSRSWLRTEKRCGRVEMVNRNPTQANHNVLNFDF